jgi:hypothetical protein
VANEIGFLEPIYIDLLTVSSLNELYDKLLDSLSLEFPYQKNRFTTLVRDAKLFGQWFQGQTIQFGKNNQRWIIIFDHLCKPGIAQEILDLPLDLGRRAFNRDLNNVWIVLLDCLPDAPERHPGRCQEEIVTPISKEQVERLLIWIEKTRRLAGDPSPKRPAPITEILGGSFPLEKEQLLSLEKNIATWWCTP